MGACKNQGILFPLIFVRFEIDFNFNFAQWGNMPNVLRIISDGFFW